MRDSDLTLPRPGVCSAMVGRQVKMSDTYLKKKKKKHGWWNGLKRGGHIEKCRRLFFLKEKQWTGQAHRSCSWQALTPPVNSSVVFTDSSCIFWKHFKFSVSKNWTHYTSVRPMVFHISIGDWYHFSLSSSQLKILQSILIGLYHPNYHFQSVNR